MPDPLSSATVVALHGLATKLVESVQDRKAAADAKEILKLVNSLNGEHFELQRQILKVEEENSKLKQRLVTLENQQVGNKPEEEDEVVALDDVSIRLMQRLANPRYSVQLPHDLASHLGVSVTRARHYADGLVSGGYLYNHRFGNGAVKYQLSEKARAFLVKHNLDA